MIASIDYILLQYIFFKFLMGPMIYCILYHTVMVYCTVRIHKFSYVHTAGWVGLGVTEREENLFEMPLTDKQWYSRPTRRLCGSVHGKPTYSTQYTVQYIR